MYFTIVLVNLLLAFIRPQEYVEGLSGIPIIPVFLLLAMALWTFVKPKNLEGPQGFLVFAFLMVSTFSHVANGWVGGAIEWFSPFAITCLMFYLLAAASSSTRRMETLMSVFILCGLVLVAHGIQQHLTGVGWTGEVAIHGRIRYIGILNDPNDMGLFLVMSLPFVFLRLQRASGFHIRIFWLLIFVAYMTAVYLTQSRGTMLSSLLIIAIVIYRRFGIMAIVALAIPLAAATAFLPQRMTNLRADEASANTRVEAWYAATQMLESNVLFGVGAGRFTDFHERTAHNTYLLVLSETGIVGFFIFMSLIGYAFMMMYEAGFRRSKQMANEAASALQYEHATARALFYSLLGFCTASLFLSRAYVVFPYILIGMISGYYAFLRRQDKQLAKFRLAENAIKWIFVTLLMVAVFYAIVKALLVLS